MYMLHTHLLYVRVAYQFLAIKIDRLSCPFFWPLN
jgi:hypothetical protein